MLVNAASDFHTLCTGGNPTRVRMYFIPDATDCTDDVAVVADGELLVKDVGDTDSNKRIAQEGFTVSQYYIKEHLASAREVKVIHSTVLVHKRNI